MTGVLIMLCSKCGKQLNIPIKNYEDANKIGKGYCKKCTERKKEKVIFT